jgi:uncharacterized protein YggE
MRHLGGTTMPVRAIALLLLLGAVSPAVAQETRPQVTLTGVGTVSVEPDLALLRAGVTTDAKTARDAAEANSRAMNAVMTAARALGIAEQDIQTSRYAIQPIYEQAGQPGRNRITGFQAVNSLTLKLRQLDRVGEVIDRLTTAGANTLGGVEFIVSEPSKLLDEAREGAIADARRKAELYAKAAGVELGRPFSIIEQSGGMQNPPMMMRVAAASETPIAPGERTLRISVSVSFDLLR